MFETNYKIEAIDVLLNEDCILTRYYPLIPYKYDIIDYLKTMNCITKSDCLLLTDEQLLLSGLPNIESVQLLKQFLCMYDINPQKLREIDKVCQEPTEAEVFFELYQLPGVKYVRAALYYKAGYESLRSIAISTPEKIISKTEEIITKEGSDLKVPLLKEVKTHIAVAKAFTFDEI